MGDYDTIEPQSVDVGVSPQFDGVTSVLEHGGKYTVVVMPPAAALAYAEMVRQAAHKALQGRVKQGVMTIREKDIVPRDKPERLDS